MNLPPSRMDLSGVVFVMDDTTTRLKQHLKPIAIEANAIFEDCLKALECVPRPQLETDPGSANALRTVSLPTRWGDISIRIYKTTNPHRVEMMVGSLEISTVIPWTRPSSADLAALISFFREAVRSIVLPENGISLVEDMRARLAGALEKHPETSTGTIQVMHPWRLLGRLTRPGMTLRDGTKPFDNGIELPIPPAMAMEIALHPPGITSAGRMSPSLTIRSLDIRLNRGAENPIDWMRLVARAAEIEKEDRS